MDDIVIQACPARISKPAWTTFEVFDKDNNLVAHNDAARPDAKDCLLSLDNQFAPFTIKFTVAATPKDAGLADVDEFPEGI